jgi:hypothetical protein
MIEMYVHYCYVSTTVVYRQIGLSQKLSAIQSERLHIHAVCGEQAKRLSSVLSIPCGKCNDQVHPLTPCNAEVGFSVCHISIQVRGKAHLNLIIPSEMMSAAKK